MTIQEFQRIVLRLSNQTHVRHFMWLNYPNDPQVMAIILIPSDGGHRLAHEMEALGFAWDNANSRYTINRDEASNRLGEGDSTRLGGVA